MTRAEQHYDSPRRELEEGECPECPDQILDRWAKATLRVGTSWVNLAEAGNVDEIARITGTHVKFLRERGGKAEFLLTRNGADGNEKMPPQALQEWLLDVQADNARKKTWPISVEFSTTEVSPEPMPKTSFLDRTMARLRARLHINMEQ